MNWKRELHKGDEVYWHDPDEESSSGYYKVISIDADNEIVCLTNDAGSYVEALFHEIE